MYEDKTFETIMAQCLARVPDTIDKREGSIIHYALAPAVAELAQAYIEMGVIYTQTSPDTATDEYMEMRAFEAGVVKEQAKASIWSAQFKDGSDQPLDITIGDRFTIAETSIFLAATQRTAAGQYKLTAEAPGAMDNRYIGSGLVPVEDNPNMASATITAFVFAGENEEQDEVLRDRTREALIDPPQDGNVAQYKKWAIEFEGVGNAKVFSLWNGGNTVKVAITNTLYRPADSALVAAFQAYIDPNIEGLGNGVAPCGSKVTATGGTQKTINVSGSVVLAEGYTEATGAAEAVSAYLASITYEKNAVSYLKVGNALLDCESIADLTGLTVNGAAVDVALVGDEIPVLGSLNLAVV